MKKILFLLITFTFSTVSAQYDWQSIYYYHSSGPVSPEYQYNYHINISADGTGKLEFTKGGKSNTYDFNVSKKSLSQLNSAIVSANVLNSGKDSIGSPNSLIGGPVNSATITLPKPQGWTKEKNPIVVIPGNIKEEYSAGVMNVYYTMEMIVPASIWQQALY